LPITINGVGERIMETGTTIRLLELADVNEDPLTATERRDEAESPGVIPLREPALLFHAPSIRRSTQWWVG